jgi:hypothetical protein
LCTSGGNGGAIGMGRGLVFACCGDRCSASEAGQFLLCMQKTDEASPGLGLGAHPIMIEYCTVLTCGGQDTPSGTICFEDSGSSQTVQWSAHQGFVDGNVTQCTSVGRGTATHVTAGPSSWEAKFSHFANCSGKSIMLHGRRCTGPLVTISHCVFWGNSASDGVVMTIAATPLVIESSMFFWNTGRDVVLDRVETPLRAFSPIATGRPAATASAVATGTVPVKATTCPNIGQKFICPTASNLGASRSREATPTKRQTLRASPSPYPIRSPSPRPVSHQLRNCFFSIVRFLINSETASSSGTTCLRSRPRRGM